MLASTSTTPTGGIALDGSFSHPAASGDQTIRTVSYATEIGSPADVTAYFDTQFMPNGNNRLHVELLVSASWIRVAQLTITTSNTSGLAIVGPFKVSRDFRFVLTSPGSTSFNVPFNIIAARF